MTTDDIKFQNDPKILRKAPWLDMPALRVEFTKQLLAAVGPDGKFRRTYKEFQNDVRDFCEGKRARCPKSPEIHGVLCDTIFALFPTARKDKCQRAAVTSIYHRFVEATRWTLHSRGNIDGVTATTGSTITITGV